MDRRARLDQHPVSGARLASFGCRKTYPIATRPSSVSPTTGEGWKLTHLQRRRGRHRRDAALHCVLHLLEGADLDLAHALARDAEFLGQLHERRTTCHLPPRADLMPLRFSSMAMDASVSAPVRRWLGPQELDSMLIRP